MDSLKRNIRLYYTISFLKACIFVNSIWMFFFTSYLTFSFHTALILMVLAGIVSFIFEIPSGAWADRFGRKKMYFLGILLIILSFFIWIFSKDLYLFVFSSILSGLGYAITSGNLPALIHDSLEENGEGNRFKDIGANAYISIFIGRIVSSLLAGYLFVIDPLLPIYMTILAYFLIFIVLIFIVDLGQQKSHSIDTKTHMLEGLNFILKENFLFYFIIIVSLISSIGNIYWFTYQPYLTQIGFSIENIGILFAISAFFSAIGAHFIKRIQDIFTEKKIIFIMIILLFISSIFFQLFNMYFAVLGLIIISVTFGFIMSFGNNVLIKKSPKTHKSTILSIFSFGITIGYTSFSIISGFIIDYFGLYKLYLGIIILIVLLFIFSVYKFRKIDLV